MREQEEKEAIRERDSEQETDRKIDVCVGGVVGAIHFVVDNLALVLFCFETERKIFGTQWKKTCFRQFRSFLFSFFFFLLCLPRASDAVRAASISHSATFFLAPPSSLQLFSFPRGPLSLPLSAAEA